MMDFTRYSDYIRQPVLVADNLSQVVTLNAAFTALFPKVRLGFHLREVEREYPMLTPLLAREEGQERFTHQHRIFMAHVSPVWYGKRRRTVARCFLLADITDADTLVHAMDAANEQLALSNRQLAEQNAEIEESNRMQAAMAAARETSAILRDLHDTLGHSLTVINALSKLALIALPDEDRCRAELSAALRLATISVAEMRAADTASGGGIVAYLHRLRASMRHAGLDIVLDIRGSESARHRYQFVPLMRICQEAATNAIRHGNATELHVRLRLGEEDISLLLKDNGKSPPTFRKGNGLIGMEERVNELFGDIEMGRDADGGFRIEITAPVIVE